MEIEAFDDIDSKAEWLNNEIVSLLDSCAPYKKISVFRQSAPWITDNIKFMMRLRNRAFSKYKCYIRKSEYNKDVAKSKWIYYQQLRNLVTASIRREKKGFVEFKFGATKNSKEWWQTINKLNIVNKPNINMPENLNDPNEFNKYFISSVPDTNISENLLNMYKSNLSNSVTSKLQLHQVDDNDVIKAISLIKSNSAGNDNISLSMLKLCLPYCLGALTHLLNFSIENNVVPTEWKKALVKPIPKKNSPEAYGDYRPISLLTIMSKVLERIVHNQLMLHIRNNNILPSNQSGFRSDHSTTTTLVNVTDDFLQAIDNSQVTTSVLLDYTKAFDCLDHELLLSKLTYFGIHSNSINWFRSYLLGRSQRVKINDLSEPLRVTKGVPQGSILGPLLFTLYIADLPNAIQFCKSQYYADDGQLYLSYNPSEIDIAMKQINSDLAAVQNFSTDHGLQINAKKSYAINFKSKRLQFSDQYCSLFINNERLTFVDTIKNLGVWFDNHLTFHDHVTKVLQNSYSKLKILYQFKTVLPISTKLRQRVCHSIYC